MFTAPNDEFLKEIASEMRRKNDLYEIELMLMAAESARGAAKYSMGRLGNDGYAIAEELVERVVERMKSASIYK